MMSNAGGAWDNTKKYIEGGAHGGKGSDCHKVGSTAIVLANEMGAVYCHHAVEMIFAYCHQGYILASRDVASQC
jgi:hypothetical protein